MSYDRDAIDAEAEREGDSIRRLLAWSNRPAARRSETRKITDERAARAVTTKKPTKPDTSQK